MNPEDIGHLDPGTAEWYTDIAEMYQLSTVKLRTLLVAAEAFDRSQQCRREVEAAGLMVLDRYGQSKVHPASDAEKSAKSLYLAALKSLDLDNVPEPVTRGPAHKYLSKSAVAIE
ncbi:MAG: hypothetical protein MK110_16210 [Fuerstiella sp.]|nr:hypothetical protein [Fuerstiella sp.]